MGKTGATWESPMNPSGGHLERKMGCIYEHPRLLKGEEGLRASWLERDLCLSLLTSWRGRQGNQSVVRIVRCVPTTEIRSVCRDTDERGGGWDTASIGWYLTDRMRRG